MFILYLTFFSLYSYSWLQLLYHCVDHIPDMSTLVLDAIQNKSDILHTCCSLLMSQLTSSVTSQLEKVSVTYVTARKGKCNLHHN